MNATGILDGGTNNTVLQCEIHATVSTVLYSTFMSIILALSLCGNALVVVSIFTSNVLKKSVSSLFIASLACSDFYFALSLIPIKISSFLQGSKFCHNLATCYWYLISDTLTNTASILNLLAIALDRYIAIKKPYIYAEKVTKKRATITIVSIWLFAFLCSLISIFNWNNKKDEIMSVEIRRLCSNTNFYFYMILYFAIYISSLLVISCIYATILHIALSHIRAIEKTNTVLQNYNNAADSRDESNLGNHSNRKGKSKRRKRELKTTKSLAIVYGAFIICWLPSCVIVVILFFDAKVFYSLQKSNQSLFLLVYYTFIEVLPSINTAVNPFIYSFSNTQFRGAFKNVLYKAIGKPNNNNNNMGYDLNSSVMTDQSNHRASSVRFSSPGLMTRFTPNVILRKLNISKTLVDIKETRDLMKRPKTETS